MHASGPEELVGWLAGLGILVVVVWRAVQASAVGALSPDPWDAATAARLEDADLKPLCTRCLCPHEETDWFCSNCGQAASATTNWMPYLYYLSLGDVLRQGTTGSFPPGWICRVGYMLISLSYYGAWTVGMLVSLLPVSGPIILIPALAPVALYWRQLARNIRRLRDELDHRATETPTAAGDATAN
jgi:hypothetical protein